MIATKSFASAGAAHVRGSRLRPQGNDLNCVFCHFQGRGLDRFAGRFKGADARRCQGGHGSWHPGQTSINQARSASIWSRWRPAMHRSSENVAAIATALAKAQTELSNPEEGDDRDYLQRPLRQLTILPVCVALEWTRHHQKNLRRPADRDCANHRHRSIQWRCQSDDGPHAYLGRKMDSIGLASLLPVKDIPTPPDGVLL